MSPNQDLYLWSRVHVDQCAKDAFIRNSKRSGGRTARFSASRTQASSSKQTSKARASLVRRLLRSLNLF